MSGLGVLPDGAWLISSPEPDTADPPGTLERENRTAIYSGWMNDLSPASMARDEAHDGHEDVLPAIQRFFAGAEEQGKVDAADTAMNLLLQGHMEITAPDLDVTYRDLFEACEWAQMRLLCVYWNPGRHPRAGEAGYVLARVVTDEDMNRELPSWRTWGQQP